MSNEDELERFIKASAANLARLRETLGRPFPEVVVDLFDATQNYIRAIEHFIHDIEFEGDDASALRQHVAEWRNLLAKSEWNLPIKTP